MRKISAFTLLLGGIAAGVCGYFSDSIVYYGFGAVFAIVGILDLISSAFGSKRHSRMKFSATVESELQKIDEMSGLEFEQYAADLLETVGFENVELTVSSHDQGADIIMSRDGVRYAVQCKVYSTRLSNTPVQEITAAREYYGCHVGIVVTNSYFTDSAVELAAANRILLWDRAYIAKLIDENM